MKSAPTPSDEAELARRIAAGEAEALREVYDRHAGRVLALSLRVLRERGEAEEIVQETFLELWRRAKQFDSGRGSLGALLATIARSRAIDRLRSRGSRQNVERDSFTAPSAPTAPDESASQGEERRRVGAALGTLPVEQRQAIELAYFEGLTQREIADRTGDPLGTVKTRVRLAMEKLTALLAGGAPPRNGGAA
ncbi:MAG: sigma-70 family RNA polymerase sigma factor [Deltaproteobacteria bacterium]